MTELSLTFTDDLEIAILNEQYRHKEGPTDVLSFSQLEGEDFGAAPMTLGDVIISVDTAERQAEEYGVTLEAELDRLLVHGILHLFGYDHENVPEEEAQEMRRLEEEILGEMSKT